MVLKTVQFYLQMMSLGELRELGMDREAWRAAIHGLDAFLQGIFLTQGLNPVSHIAGRFFTCK